MCASRSRWGFRAPRPSSFRRSHATATRGWRARTRLRERAEGRTAEMTFTDAAAEVLRLVGRPLHYKEITDIAIEKNLLSHVGKSPEVTMGARLAALVKKGDRENPLVRIKPGVFALREWDPATIEKGLEDRTPALERLAAQGYSGEPQVDVGEEAPADAASSPHASHVTFDDEDGVSAPDEGERSRAE